MVRTPPLLPPFEENALFFHAQLAAAVPPSREVNPEAREPTPLRRAFRRFADLTFSGNVVLALFVEAGGSGGISPTRSDQQLPTVHHPPGYANRSQPASHSIRSVTCARKRKDTTKVFIYTNPRAQTHSHTRHYGKENDATPGGETPVQFTFAVAGATFLHRFTVSGGKGEGRSEDRRQKRTKKKTLLF